MSNESPNPDPYATSDQPSPPGVSTATYHPDEGVGSMIGPYKLLQLMGKGGMGAVWMAEQTEPVQRRVAVKIIKAGLEGYQVLARFEAERQALAMMDHPNIAKVLDAGATAAGRPYFVMELVKGIAFTKYCDQEHLTPKERLELFIPVCNAVQHAHQKGIIHRDLKPSNVLIALYDGKPVPKVIDFGIAKATHQKLTERTMFTEVGQIVGTLEYMAPEQAEMNNLDIDTRADIYSLGVMLYELLTGAPPFPAKMLRAEAYLEMLRIIREVEPSKPSTKLSKSEELPAIAAKRKLEPKKLTGMVQGDLDWIVMKCLEKDRGRRYDEAKHLSQELQRFLADELVQARPPSIGYKAKKFLRRNKGSVFATGLVFLALIAGIIGTSIVLLDREPPPKEADDRGTLVVETDDPDVVVVVKQDGKIVVILDKTTGKEITLRAGMYVLELSGGKDGLKLSTQQLVLKGGDKEIVKVEPTGWVAKQPLRGWVAKKDLRTSVGSAMAVEMNGRIYCVGGNGVSTSQNIVQVYDPANDTWERRAPFPRPDGSGPGRYAGSLGVIGGKLYLAGGWWRVEGGGLPTDTLLIHDPNKDEKGMPGLGSWSEGRRMDTRSGNSLSGVIGGKFYVLTGSNGTADLQKRLDVYDPHTNKWTSLKPAPHIHMEGAAGVIDNKLYVVGRSDGKSVSADVDVYDPETGMWTTKEPIPVGPINGGAVIDGKLYVVGASASVPNRVNSLVYDPRTERWSQLPPLRKPRVGAAVVAIGKTLYALGGSDGHADRYTVEALDLATLSPPGK